ncbi:hypothetical protein [Amycolatopsis circi]|uniref:hypothetical protein n=1 Tax=Amycolatopsis circi TaxID=871959 RepID=UPI001ABF551A|nr:hypothetical protein [Amycolatopsis circi]
MATTTQDEDVCIHCATEVIPGCTRTNVDDELVCDDCTPLHYLQCDNCAHIFRTLLTVEDDSESLCDDCAAEAGYHECLDCTYLVRGRARCTDCADRLLGSWDDHVYGSGYKPYPRFHGSSPLFLGMELEINTPDRDTQLCQLCEDRLGGLAYLKEDGSITVGFELVTHPMSLAWAQDNFPWTLLDELAARGCHTTDDVGLHIHVSREAFDGRSHVFRWMKFIYRNAAEVQQLARRHDSSWAQFSPGERAGIKDICKGDQNRPRYSAINVQNADTFELRMFASSIKPQEVQAALAFADASVRYAQQLTLRAIVRDDGWSWEAFLGWAAERPEYDALSRECEALACAC